MKTPVVITSLEDDFKKIGLIKESSETTKATEASQSEDSELDEAARIKKRVQMVGGSLKAVKTQRTSMADRMAAKQYRRSAAGKTSARLQAKKRRSGKGKRRAAKVAKVASMKGTRKESMDAQETLKAFANAAIIADKLASIFTEWVKADIYESEDERMFAGLAGELAEIAESFADIATAMSEGKLEESSDEDIAAAFSEGLEVVLDAVDLYEANADDESDDESDDEDDSGND